MIPVTQMWEDKAVAEQSSTTSVLPVACCWEEYAQSPGSPAGLLTAASTSISTADGNNTQLLEARSRNMPEQRKRHANAAC